MVLKAEVDVRWHTIRHDQRPTLSATLWRSGRQEQEDTAFRDAWWLAKYGWLATRDKTTEELDDFGGVGFMWMPRGVPYNSPQRLSIATAIPSTKTTSCTVENLCLLYTLHIHTAQEIGLTTDQFDHHPFYLTITLSNLAHVYSSRVFRSSRNWPGLTNLLEPMIISRDSFSMMSRATRSSE